MGLNYSYSEEDWKEFYYNSLDKADKNLFTMTFNAYKAFIGEEIEITHTIFLSFLIRILNESINKEIKFNFIQRSNTISEKILNSVLDTLEEKLDTGIEQVMQEGIKNNKEINDYICDEIYVNFSIVFNESTNINNKKTSGTNKGYDSFGNKFIVQELLEGYGDIFKRYEYFINFLIKKINNAKTKKEINKIPMIVSNLSNYKGKNANEAKIFNLRSKLMNTYKNKKYK